MRLLSLGAALALGLAAGSVHAETYFSLYTGASENKDSDLHVQQPRNGTHATFHDISWRGEPFEQPPYYGYKIGHYSRTDPNWGVEFDFTHYKVFAHTSGTYTADGTWNGAPLPANVRLDNYVQSFSISHGVNVLALNVLYRVRTHPTPSFPHGRFQPYVGAGPNFYVLHPENTVNNRGNAQKYKSSGIGWQALAGVHYGISKRTGVFVEGKYNSGQAKVETADGGWAETDLRTWHLAGGVRYGY